MKHAYRHHATVRNVFLFSPRATILIASMALHFIPQHASTAAHASLCDIVRSANLTVPASRDALAKHLQQNSDTSTQRVSLRFEFNCA